MVDENSQGPWREESAPRALRRLDSVRGVGLSLVPVLLLHRSLQPDRDLRRLLAESFQLPVEQVRGLRAVVGRDRQVVAPDLAGGAVGLGPVQGRAFWELRGGIHGFQ